VYAVKHISGGHLNPAVSLAAAGTGFIDWTRGLLYILAQARGLEGAWLAARAGLEFSPGCLPGRVCACVN
jgi:glycerol uptake facilitator-like aquaporin